MVELIWEPFGVVRRLSGVVDAAQLDDSAKKIQGNVLTDQLKYIIHDFTDCTDVRVSEADVEFMASRAAVALQRNPRVKIAFVGDHPVAHALVSLFNSYALAQHRCHLFGSLEAARSYIAAA